MKKELEELRKEALLDLYSWGGLGPTPGCSGTLITQDRKIYTYHIFHFISPSLKEMNIPKESLDYLKTISEEEYKEVEKYIETNILNKNYKSMPILDASFHINGSYKGQYFKLTNVSDDKDNILYFSVNKMIEKIKGEIKNEEK